MNAQNNHDEYLRVYEEKNEKEWLSKQKLSKIKKKNREREQDRDCIQSILIQIVFCKVSCFWFKWKRAWKINENERWKKSYRIEQNADDHDTFEIKFENAKKGKKRKRE